MSENGVSPHTRMMFEAAKLRKGDNRLIPCPCCEGVGSVIDAKSGKIRDCVGCKSSGKINNPKFKFQQA